MKSSAGSGATYITNHARVQRERQMSAAQIQKAQALAQRCQDTKYQECE